MATINIGADNAGDAFYRYKMPKLQARIEGRGNGIKTNVVNNVDIAKALERPPEYVLKWYGCELGAQTKFDKKTGTSIVNGAHDTGKLTEMLESFIKKYVQCYSCGNPETVVKIKKENIYLKCKACGYVSEVDPRYRLNSFIVKNPPENKMSKAEKKVKKAEKDRLKGLAAGAEDGSDGCIAGKDKKLKKKSSSKKNITEGSQSEETSEVVDDDDDDDDDEDDDVVESDVVWQTDTSEEAMRRRAEEQLSKATAAMVTQGNIEAEREAALRREAKRKEEEDKARLAAETTKKLALEAAGGDEAVAAVRAAARSKDATPSSVKDALNKADVQGGAAQKMRVLYDALFGDVGGGGGEKLTPKIKAAAPMLAPHAKDPAAQLAHLVALEHLLGVTLASTHIKEAALAYKVLYDEDIAEEQLIMAWYNKKAAGGVLNVPEESAEAVRQATKPFYEWLEQEDSDEESGEESDDE